MLLYHGLPITPSWTVVSHSTITGVQFALLFSIALVESGLNSFLIVYMQLLLWDFILFIYMPWLAICYSDHLNKLSRHNTLLTILVLD